MTARTERPPVARSYHLAGEGRKGMTKEAQS
jgi:hypothetical protein